MPADQPKIAIVGAAGFVGRELLRQLDADGIKATAVARGIPELIVEGTIHDVATPNDAGGGDYDVVVNLAYPTSGAPYNYPDQNAAILGTVNRLIKDGGDLIHASTLAVFGLALDRPVSVGPVEWTRDEAYVEAKVEAEHTVTEDTKTRGLRTDILRFGNIWGRASGAWALPVLHRLLTGRPIGVESGFGFSNTTDVANAASYLRHLAVSGTRARQQGVKFHHLAEFSGERWERWVDPIAELLGVEPELVPDDALDRPGTVRGELVEGLDALNPRRLGRAMSKDRLVGSWERSILRKFPAKTRDDIKGRAVFAREPRLGRPDQTFLAIMSASQEFATSVEAEWQQPLDYDASLARVIEWIGDRS